MSCLTPEALRGYSVIAPNALSGQTPAFDDLMSILGASADRLIRCNSLNAVVEVTVSRVGISVPPQKYVQPMLRRKLLERLKSESAVPPLQYTSVWRRDGFRPLISSIKDLVTREVDFNLSTPLWEVQ